MANMEFLTANLLNTTTQAKVDSNTDTVEFLFDGNLKIGYSTEGYSSNTSTILSIEFDSPTIISHVLMQVHNLKDFRVFYDSVTANSLDVTSSNSATSSYISFSSVTVSSIQIQMDQAMTADTEKEINELVIAERQTQFERNPNIKNYKPIIDRTQVRHVMPDGGITLFNVRDKFKTKLKWEFITQSFHDTLKDIYDDGDALVFVPFPTTTAWDGNGYEVVWSKDFDFKHSTNDKQQGFGGNIILEQTANA